MDFVVDGLLVYLYSKKIRINIQYKFTTVFVVSLILNMLLVKSQNKSGLFMEFDTC